MSAPRQNATDGDILRFLAEHDGKLTAEQIRFGLAERKGLRATVERIRRVVKDERGLDEGVRRMLRDFRRSERVED